MSKNSESGNVVSAPNTGRVNGRLNISFWSALIAILVGLATLGNAISLIASGPYRLSHVERISSEFETRLKRVEESNTELRVRMEYLISIQTRLERKLDELMSRKASNE